MNYEQRYKEALEAVKELQEANPSDDGIKNWVEEKFPELKESGDYDERIRKALIDGFKRYDYGALFNGCFVREILAWLEKQEVKSSPYNDVSISHDNGVDILFDKKLVKHISGEKQDEQNLNACLNYIPDESLRMWLTDTIHAKYDKIAWSEEDEQNFNAVLSYINDESLRRWLKDAIYKKYDKPVKWSNEDHERYISCLKRLGTGNPQQPETVNSKWFKEHCRPYSKQEWSEEDEGFLNLLLAIFKVEHPNGIFSTGNITVFNEDSVTSNRIIDWLKSLKERYFWKPNKEQLKFLQHYADQSY